MRSEQNSTTRNCIVKQKMHLSLQPLRLVDKAKIEMQTNQLISKNVDIFNKVKDRFMFFYLGFLSQTFTVHRTAGEGGDYLFNSSVPLPPVSHALTH